MRSFLFTAKNSSGGAVTARTEAQSLPEARQRLEAEGYTEIFFEGDELTADVRESLNTQQAPWVNEIPWSPEDELASRRRTSRGARLWWIFKQHLVYLGPLLLWNAVSCIHGRPFRTLDFGGFIATGLYLVYFAYAVLPGQAYYQIVDATVWRDWPRMRFYIGLYRALDKVRGSKIALYDIRAREAYALAAEGKLDPALTIMEDLRAMQGTKEYLHCSRLGSVYQYAEQYNEYVHYIREFQRLGPPGASGWVELATALARRTDNFDEARNALCETRKNEMTPLVAWFANRAEGILEVRQKNYPIAKAALERALAKNDLITGGNRAWADAEIKAYLAIACAHTGEKKRARTYWQQARPMMIARREKDIVANAESALTDSSLD